MGQVCVVKERDSVWLQAQDLVYGFLISLRTLVGKAVNQISADGSKTKIARLFEHLGDHSIRLDTINRLLYFFVEILHAQTDAIKSHAMYETECIKVGVSRINFNGVLPGLIM